MFYIVLIIYTIFQLQYIFKCFDFKILHFSQFFMLCLRVEHLLMHLLLLLAYFFCWCLKFIDLLPSGLAKNCCVVLRVLFALFWCLDSYNSTGRPAFRIICTACLCPLMLAVAFDFYWWHKLTILQKWAVYSQFLCGIACLVFSDSCQGRSSLYAKTQLRTHKKIS